MAQKVLYYAVYFDFFLASKYSQFPTGRLLNLPIAQGNYGEITPTKN
jgi:hypothetical protein